jgi:hypothetical protein
VSSIPEDTGELATGAEDDVTTDALIVSIADYPSSGGLLRPLPGATRDSVRVRKFIAANSSGVNVRDVCWPLRDLPAGQRPLPWSKFQLDEQMRQFVSLGLQGMQDRLFVYISGHARCTVQDPAMPAVYCASHSRNLPDLFAPAGWVKLLTAGALYREYLFFFDCCNDMEPGQVPQPPPFELPYRKDTPSVLVLAACAPNQQAVETDKGGVFTDVLLEALSGSAGGRGEDVTARDLVDYVKEWVPKRANALDPGRQQTPKEWFDPGMHGDLAAFKLFKRPRVSVDVGPLLDGRAAADVEVLGADLEPAGALVPGAAPVVLLGDVYPGKYVLRARAGDWRRLVLVKTSVDDDGKVQPVVESVQVA